MDLIIRKMNLSDISFVYNEEIKIFGKSLGEKTLYKEIMYNDLSRYFVALIESKRVGYVGSWLTITNAEILNLFVINGYRGHGIGKLLMNEVISICIEENIEILSLEVNVTNFYAVKMYEDLGFIVRSIRKKYYNDKEDALLMIKELGGKV